LDLGDARESLAQSIFVLRGIGAEAVKVDLLEEIQVGRRPLAVTAAWGQNRELNFALDGYLLEWDFHLSPVNSIYGRGELVLKEIFGLGVHPAGLLNHPRNFSQINALTVGYIRELPWLGPTLGIGADVTVHDTSRDLIEFYGSPHSYHVFLRWRPARATVAHVH